MAKIGVGMYSAASPDPCGEIATDDATILRVFPRRTSLTPRDPLAFVGDPPLIRPQADEVHISVAFTWDVEEGKRLAQSWGQYYPMVRLGGPAIGISDGFIAGRYVRSGLTFTSRGCDNCCPWCLVPEREGKVWQLDSIAEGWDVGDNNFLQCSLSHRAAVYSMLRRQMRAARFSGGLQASLLTDVVADELRGLRINEIFLAADSEGALKPLAKALGRLAWLPRKKKSRYVLIGFEEESLTRAEAS